MKKTTNQNEYIVPMVDIYLTEPAEMLCTSAENPDIFEEDYAM